MTFASGNELVRAVMVASVSSGVSPERRAVKINAPVVDEVDRQDASTDAATVAWDETEQS
jgi:plastocyanin domain-containing protein